MIDRLVFLMKIVVAECDLVKGLKESVKLQWSGDVDLNDGCLHKQYDEYKKRLESRKGCTELKELLLSLVHNLEYMC